MWGGFEPGFVPGFEGASFGLMRPSDPCFNLSLDRVALGDQVSGGVRFLGRHVVRMAKHMRSELRKEF